MRLDQMLETAGRMVACPVRMPEVIARIQDRLDDGDTDLTGLRDLARMIDRAAWESDGVGLTSILVALLVALESVDGVVPEGDALSRCAHCEEMMPPGSGKHCSTDCRDKDRNRRRWRARRARQAAVSGTSMV